MQTIVTNKMHPPQDMNGSLASQQDPFILKKKQLTGGPNFISIIREWINGIYFQGKKANQILDVYVKDSVQFQIIQIDIKCSQLYRIITDKIKQICIVMRREFDFCYQYLDRSKEELCDMRNDQDNWKTNWNKYEGEDNNNKKESNPNNCKIYGAIGYLIYINHSYLVNANKEMYILWKVLYQKCKVIDMHLLVLQQTLNQLILDQLLSENQACNPHRILPTLQSSLKYKFVYEEVWGFEKRRDISKYQNQQGLKSHPDLQELQRTSIDIWNSINQRRKIRHQKYKELQEQKVIQQLQVTPTQQNLTSKNQQPKSKPKSTIEVINDIILTTDKQFQDDLQEFSQKHSTEQVCERDKFIEEIKVIVEEQISAQKKNLQIELSKKQKKELKIKKKSELEKTQKTKKGDIKNMMDEAKEQFENKNSQLQKHGEELKGLKELHTFLQKKESDDKMTDAQKKNFHYKQEIVQCQIQKKSSKKYDDLIENHNFIAPLLDMDMPSIKIKKVTYQFEQGKIPSKTYSEYKIYDEQDKQQKKVIKMLQQNQKRKLIQRLESYLKEDKPNKLSQNDQEEVKKKKKKRKKKKKSQKKDQQKQVNEKLIQTQEQQVKSKVQIEKSEQEKNLFNFLQTLEVEDKARFECNVDEKMRQKWLLKLKNLKEGNEELQQATQKKAYSKYFRNIDQIKVKNGKRGSHLISQQ